ncbi:2-hydroxy-acid oxidase [Aliidongia dinghuensis]|uniref:2-hydroxy-acid oxidase n=1 Tax=Aliidongia dinghuensis TaxID=1867774 RepID=A0A8J2YV16_9PROT|nr:glycolate oxidase subunit GlcE [Aliidongia dinghuensis]GGF23726.1 2-hydroxy-acid oxidase [Aliidongia dinghuensis]
MNVLRPDSAAAVEEAIATAAAERTPLEITGAGTKRGWGRPVEAAQGLSLAGLRGITLYEAEELVLSARAGTTLAEIELSLAQKGQQLAFEPPDWAGLYGAAPGTQTIGGIIACNLAGPRRLTAGAARDHLLGFHAVSGRGEPFKSGGRVVKNVTGFDLSKLMAGSFGTLAVMTEVTLKVLPRPETAATLLLLGQDAATAVGSMAAALGSSNEVSGAAWLPATLAGRLGIGEGAAVTALRFEGLAESVAYRVAALGSLIPGAAARLEGVASDAFWRAVGNADPLASDPLASDPPASDPARDLWRVSVAPLDGARLIAALPEAEAYLDWAGGLVWLALPASTDGGAARVRQAKGQAGHATLVRAGAEARARTQVFEPEPPALTALSRRIKASFDPLGLLNPGRMVEGR